MISKYQKVFPKVDYHDYKIHHFYTYVYLDPFDETNLVYNINGQKVEFAYRPIYIGKATNKGYRHSQHIAEYVKNGSESNGYRTIHNQIKKETFRQLETNMRKRGHSSPDFPSNWKEYQDNWVIIMKTYNSQIQLQQGEKDLIRGIGTIKTGRGPLTNAILG